jgi:hypothetical protein
MSAGFMLPLFLPMLLAGALMIWLKFPAERDSYEAVV